MRRMSSSRVIGAGVLLGLAGPGMAACDHAPPQPDAVSQDTRFQCAIERNGVEEAVDCDDVNDNDGTAYVGGGYYPVFIHSAPVSGSAYAPGQALPSQNRHRIGYKDATGRQQWGLPPSGKVSNNYTTKVNVIGKGGPPAVSAKSGS